MENTEIIESLMEQLKNSDEFKNITALLSLDDDKFQILSTGILVELEKQLNDSNVRLALAQTLPTNIKASDIEKTVNTILDSLKKQKDLSPIKQEFLEKTFLIFINALTQSQGTALKPVRIPIELCREGAKIPSYAHDGDAAMDIYSPEEYTILPGETKIIPTGLKVELPFGYAFLIQPRSGVSSKTKLRIANSPGLIDSQFRGEIGIIIENIEPPIKDITFNVDSCEYGKSYVIEKGERIAQLRLVEVPTAIFYQVDKVNENTSRATGGFGSTGKK